MNKNPLSYIIRFVEKKVHSNAGNMNLNIKGAKKVYTNTKLMFWKTKW